MSDSSHSKTTPSQMPPQTSHHTLAARASQHDSTPHQGSVTSIVRSAGPTVSDTGLLPVLTVTFTFSPTRSTAISKLPPNAFTSFNCICPHALGNRGVTEKEFKPVGLIPNSPSVITRQNSALSADK